MTPKYPHVVVRLVGEDGNAFAVLGRVRQAMRRDGVPEAEIEKFLEEAKSGDYDNLLITCMKWVTVE